MKAICYHRYGSPDVLALEDVEKPAIDDDGVLVRVAASSVNALDWHYLRGTPYIARVSFGLRRPKKHIPGVDVAGRVEAVGRNVTGLRPGDEVFGAADGAFAEFVAGRERDFAPKPANVTLEQAAAVPIAAITALQALRDRGQVRPGERVLIYGAGGGVGTFAVQIAKALGAHVVAVTRTEHMDMVRSIGADEVVDYTREDFSRGEARYDLICGVGGNRSVSDYLRALTADGTFVFVGADNPLTALLQTKFHRRTLSFLAVRKKDDLLVLKDFIEAGKIVPVVDRTFPLDQAAEAIRYVEAGKVRGKVVVTV
jgi:NADPH:quinone reductase-like Zn-dependent oxidoreductase